MKNSGIRQFFLKNNDFVIKFEQHSMRCCPFDPRTRSISKIMEKMHQKLKHEPDYGSLKPALLDIENQLIERSEEIFSNVRQTSDKSNETNEYISSYIDKVTKLRQQHLESKFSYKDWQSSVAKKYFTLQAIINKNFPEAWPLLQFCLAVKSILHIDGCSLPFMGVILGIPSSMKTLVIQLFRKYPQSLYSDNFTPAAFVSHNAALSEEQLRKVDLLPKLSDKFFLTPELAPIFTVNEDELRKSLGIITRILDGHGFETDSGAQGHRRYENTFFVWIGAAVEIPFRVWQLLGTLGHKIYFFRPVIAEKTIEQLEKIAKDNDFPGKFKKVEEALLEYLMEFDSASVGSNSRIDENRLVKVKWNENVHGEQTAAITCIAHTANLQRRSRGTVFVSQSKTKTRYNSSHSSNANDNKANSKSNVSDLIASDEADYDTDYPIVEDPSRAVVMLRNLALGNAISQGRDYINLQDASLIINVALSTTTKARSELIQLLLKKSGELTTSMIVNENKISAPFAKKTMRELAALGIVDISTVAGYNNSELKITLKDEYGWFKDQDFHKLFNKNETSDHESDDDSNTIAGKEAAAESKQSESEISKEDSEQSERSVGNNSDSFRSHPETKSTPETHVENSDACDSFNENNFPDGTLNNNSNQLHTSERKSDGQPKIASSDSTDTCDKEPKSGQKNNAPVWGPESFRRVTVLSSHEQPKAEDRGISVSDMHNLALKEVVKIIKGANGAIVSFNTAIESVCRRNVQVRTYLGEKLTSRENKKVRNLALDIIRNKNIEVVKHKPLLLVRWIEPIGLNHDSETII